MKFSITPVLVIASAVTGVFANPITSSSEVEQQQPRSLVSSISAHRAPSLDATDALTIIENLNGEIHKMAASINEITSSVKKSSSKDEKKAATEKVGKHMTDITMAINNAVGQIGLKSNKAHFGDSDVSVADMKKKSGHGVQGLANALKTTLVTLAGTVNTALAVLGLTPLLAFLTPLTGSLSGLVLTLVAVVDSLLPILNTILDGVVVGLSGLLAGLVL